MCIRDRYIGIFPSFIIDVRSIEKIVDSYSGKYDHFMIRAKKLNLHLKCDIMDEKKKWIDSINFMRDQYKSDKTPFILQKELDDEIKLEILSENDLRYWNEIKVYNIYFN